MLKMAVNTVNLICIFLNGMFSFVLFPFSTYDPIYAIRRIMQLPGADRQLARGR